MPDDMTLIWHEEHPNDGQHRCIGVSVALGIIGGLLVVADTGFGWGIALLVVAALSLALAIVLIDRRKERLWARGTLVDKHDAEPYAYDDPWEYMLCTIYDPS